jgi:hypothetical protein
MIALFIASQLILLPLIGMMFLGIRNERLRQQRLLEEALVLANRRNMFLRKH